MSPAGSYHHGDLRRALMDEALVLMNERGVEALSLRELARRLGVTYGAPHHHFAEKDDLFAALAEASFAELLVREENALRQAPEEPRERVKVLAEVYLEYAMTERTRYRVMFLPQLRDRERFASLHETGGQSMRLLTDAFVATGMPLAAARTRAFGCWACLHGFAQLANDGFVEATGAALRALTRDMVDIAIR